LMVSFSAMLCFVFATDEDWYDSVK
jgi:hypothetical protein